MAWYVIRMPKKLTLEELMERFQEAHGGYYDYSAVEYVNSNTKVKVGCPEHGEFEITPSHHSRGVGCRKCYFESQKTSKEDFITQSQSHFGDGYDYSFFPEMPRVGEKIRIYCRTHDRFFEQEPRNHMRGHIGCPNCRSIKLAGPRDDKGTLRTAEALTLAFVNRAMMVHGSAYDYTEFQYVNANTKGKIVCPQHGAFWQDPSNHLRGSRCPVCARESRKVDTFKEKCAALGVGYWRALKRREAGLSEEKIFEEGYVRHIREINKITVSGITYPNLKEAIRVLQPPASGRTIARLIREGMPPEEAFAYIPNPGYAKGIIYQITHKGSGKKYVGLTVQTLERRWKGHINTAMAGDAKGEDSLHAALRESGSDAFEIRQIDEGTTKMDLERKEKDWIEKLGTMVPDGFNISSGGVSGGSNKKPTLVDGVPFASVGKAAEYLSGTRGISLEAAKGRLRHNRTDAKTPAKPGESLINTPVYKTWSRIFHGALNPKSKEYIAGVAAHPAWRDFTAFYQDVGPRPASGMAFARLDKSKGFYPDNCAWLSKSEASRLNALYMKEKGTLVGKRNVGKKNAKPTA